MKLFAINFLLFFSFLKASSHEVLNTKLIITCIEAGRQYIPPIDFYKTDFIARMLLVINSAINFLIYCAVSSQFQVSSIIFTQENHVLSSIYQS